MIRRGSPIHDQVYAGLTTIGANRVRFVPWTPYPQLAVAELQPPTGNPSNSAALSVLIPIILIPVCGQQVTYFNLSMRCYEGVITDIQFAS